MQSKGASGIIGELLANEQAFSHDWSLLHIESIAGIHLLQHFQPDDHTECMKFPSQVLEVPS